MILCCTVGGSAAVAVAAVVGRTGAVAAVAAVVVAVGADVCDGSVCEYTNKCNVRLLYHMCCCEFNL